MCEVCLIIQEMGVYNIHWKIRYSILKICLNANMKTAELRRLRVPTSHYELLKVKTINEIDFV